MDEGRWCCECRIHAFIVLILLQAQDGLDSNPGSHAPTPTASFAPQLSARDSGVGSGMKAPNKKKRPADKDEDDEKAQKRGKITYARD